TSRRSPTRRESADGPLEEHPRQPEESVRTGIWLVGGRGSVATTTIVGAAAIRAGVADPVGCVSAAPPFQGLDLPGFDELVFGGHDVAQTALPKRAAQLAEAGVVPRGLLDLVADDVLAADREMRPVPDGASVAVQADLIDALAADLLEFRRRRGLAR